MITDKLYNTFAIPLADTGLETIRAMRNTYDKLISQFTDLASGRPLNWNEKLAMKYLSYALSPYVSVLGKLPTEAIQALTVPSEIGYRTALSDYYAQTLQQSKISPELMQQFIDILKQSFTPSSSTTSPTTSALPSSPSVSSGLLSSYKDIYKMPFYTGSLDFIDRR